MSPCTLFEYEFGSYDVAVLVLLIVEVRIEMKDEQNEEAAGYACRALTTRDTSGQVFASTPRARSAQKRAQSIDRGIENRILIIAIEMSKE